MIPAADHDLLIDTHIVIWLSSETARVPPSILNAIMAANRCFVSHVTALEIQIKNQKTPEIFEFSLESLEAAMRAFSFQQLSLTYADIRAFGSMEFLHKDPFDRLLMTQAVSRDLTFVSMDRDIIRTAEQFKAFRVLGA